MIMACSLLYGNCKFQKKLTQDSATPKKGGDVLSIVAVVVLIDKQFSNCLTIGNLFLVEFN